MNIIALVWSILVVFVRFFDSVSVFSSQSAWFLAQDVIGFLEITQGANS